MPSTTTPLALAHAGIRPTVLPGLPDEVSAIRQVQIRENRGGVDAADLEEFQKFVHRRVKTILRDTLESIKDQTGISVEDASGLNRGVLYEEIAPVVADYHIERILLSKPNKAIVVDDEPIEHDLNMICDILVATHGNISIALKPYFPRAA